MTFYSETYPPTIVMKVYNVNPRINRILVILTNSLTDHRLSAPIRTIPAEMATAGERVRVQ